MTVIRGASQFLNQATLTNLQGTAAQSANVLGEAAGGVGILDIGRNLAVQGVGISNNARNLNRQFLEQSSGTFNQLFSTTGGGSATVEAAQTQILALRSSVPATRETPDVREAVAEASATAEAERGAIVDESI